MFKSIATHAAAALAGAAVAYVVITKVLTKD